MVILTADLDFNARRMIVMYWKSIEEVEITHLQAHCSL